MSERERDQQGENHENAVCDTHSRDRDRLPGAGATRPVRAAGGLPAKRLLQRLPAERVVPHRRVVTFVRLLENCEGADGSSAPSRRCTARPRLPQLPPATARVGPQPGPVKFATRLSSNFTRSGGTSNVGIVAVAPLVAGAAPRVPTQLLPLNSSTQVQTRRE